jgi:flagellar basal-body rod protein FlgF
MSLQSKLDVVANNVANADTTGFRAKQPTFQEYLSPAKESEPSKKERPVSLVDLGLTYTNTSRGAVKLTGNPLDVAINGEAYFVVQTDQGDRYTRDGSFTLDNVGRLVTADGKPVMTESGVLKVSSGEGDIVIGADGSVSNKKGVIGRLRLVNFDGAEPVRSSGANLVRSDRPPIAIIPGSIQLVSGALEKSNVEAVFEMSRLNEMTRSYEMVSGLLKGSQNPDDLNKLANVPE